MGYLWLNARGTYLRQRLVAQALHMATRRPTILILAEAQSRAGPEDPPFLDYMRHIVLPADGKTGAGLDVDVRSRTTSRATLLWGKEDANAFLMEVLTPWGKHHVLAAHAPQINIGCEPYVRWWAKIRRKVTRMVDPMSVLVVADTNSAAQRVDREPHALTTWAIERSLGPSTSGIWWTCTRSPLTHNCVSREPQAPALIRSHATAMRRSQWHPTTISVAPSCLTTMSPSASPLFTQWPGSTSPAPIPCPVRQNTTWAWWPKPTSGNRLAGDSRSGWTRRWGVGSCRCATSCGSRLFWNSGRQLCTPPPCSGPTWSALGPTHWGLSSYATSSRSPSESGTPTPRRVPRC